MGDGPIGLISLRKREAEVGLSEIRKSRIDASRRIKSSAVWWGCAKIALVQLFRAGLHINH